jgi:hypothetical protein
MLARKAHSAPVKVYERTYRRIRLAASIFERKQADIMEEAMEEYIDRHADEFALGLKQAREALFGSSVSAVAYMLGENADELKDVAGPEDDRPIRVRKAVRPTPTPDSR